MGKRGLFLLCLFVVSLLNAGCAISNQPEHLAFAVSLSIDRSDAGAYTVGVQIPSLGGSSGDTGLSEDAGGYEVYTAAAATFPEALALLQNTMPGNLKLSELKSILVSERLAQDPAFPAVMEEVLLTRGLYGVARVIVCLGDAQAFLKAQKPVVGTRLSASLNAELEHHAKQGTIPLTSLTELYSRTRSIYSDPMLSLAATGGERESGIPEGNRNEALPGQLPRTGSNENEYLGAALLRNGVMVGALNGQQTAWALLLCGQIQRVSMTCQGKSLQLNNRHAPKLRWLETPSKTTVEVDLDFEVIPLTDLPELEVLRGLVEAQVLETMRVCQQAQTEPFGLVERLAWRSATFEAFEANGARSRWAKAELRLRVDLRGV